MNINFMTTPKIIEVYMNKEMKLLICLFLIFATDTNESTFKIIISDNIIVIISYYICTLVCTSVDKTFILKL